MKSPVSRGGSDRQAQSRRDEPVGELLGMILHARIADRRGFDQPRDLAGRRGGANPYGANRQLSVANDGGGEYRLAFRPHDRQSLAGDRFLVDHGVTVDDLAIDRNDVAGIDDDMIIDRQLGRRHGHDRRCRE